MLAHCQHSFFKKRVCCIYCCPSPTQIFYCNMFWCCLLVCYIIVYYRTSYLEQLGFICEKNKKKKKTNTSFSRDIKYIKILLNPYIENKKN